MFPTIGALAMLAYYPHCYIIFYVICLWMVLIFSFFLLLNEYFLTFLWAPWCRCIFYKIIYLRVINLFVTLNYLFALLIKLFRHVDSFVLDIFLLFILYNQMFTICNILFVVYCYLFAPFNSFFMENKYLFMLLKCLFAVAKINYWVLKNIFF